MRIYSLLDLKGGVFSHLVLSENDEMMKRSLHSELKGSGTLQEKYASDFALHAVGEFDRDTGLVTPERVPVLVCLVSDILGV